jgi:hypothetical protein
MYEGGWDIEQVRIIGSALNMSLVIEDGNETEYHKGPPSIYVGRGGGDPALYSLNYSLTEYEQSYPTVHYAWYTPRAGKYQRWSRSFEIFSVDMWISLVLSLLLAVITVSCISN